MTEAATIDQAEALSEDADAPKEALTRVLRMLIRHRSMPFLELESLTEMDEGLIRQAVDRLEEQHFVRTDHRGDLFREIVTATGRALQPVRRARIASP